MFAGLFEGLRTRIRHANGQGGTFFLPIGKLYEYCEKHPKNKNFATPGVFFSSRTVRKQRTSKKTIVSKTKESTKLARVAWRVIDLDSTTAATREQVVSISHLVPTAPLCWSNGVQIRLKPYGSWEKDAPMLAAIGRELARLTGLFYDPLHLNKYNEPSGNEGHCYRLPLSWANRAKRAAINLHPLTHAGLGHMNVKEAFDAIGCSLPPKIPRPVRKARMANPASASPRVGSHGPKWQEFSEALSMLGKMKFQGVPREEAYQSVLAHPWVHLKAHELRASFDKYAEIWAVAYGDGEFVENSRDQIEYRSHLIDSAFITAKQKLMQRSFKLYAHRAWSLNLFYDMGFTEDETVMGFVLWKAFKTIRRLSLAASSRSYVRRNIRTCYEKFSGGKGARPADPALVEKVWSYITSNAMNSFSTGDIPRHLVGVTSYRHMQRILGLLKGEGKLKLVRRKWTRASPTPPTSITLTNTLYVARSTSPSPSISPHL